MENTVKINPEFYHSYETSAAITDLLILFFDNTLNVN
jgi:hypothetical protein